VKIETAAAKEKMGISYPDTAGINNDKGDRYDASHCVNLQRQPLHYQMGHQGNYEQ
jgi:hypothetical protein